MRAGRFARRDESVAFSGFWYESRSGTYERALLISSTLMKNAP